MCNLLTFIYRMCSDSFTLELFFVVVTFVLKSIYRQWSIIKKRNEEFCNKANNESSLCESIDSVLLQKPISQQLRLQVFWVGFLIYTRGFEQFILFFLFWHAPSDGWQTALKCHPCVLALDRGLGPGFNSCLTLIHSSIVLSRCSGSPWCWKAISPVLRSLKAKAGFH